MKTMFALATVAVIGSASFAMAGEGSPDLAVPSKAEYYSSQYYGPSQGMWTTSEVAAQDGYRAWAQPQRGPSWQERIMFDRETGSVDTN